MIALGSVLCLLACAIAQATFAPEGTLHGQAEGCALRIRPISAHVYSAAQCGKFADVLRWYSPAHDESLMDYYENYLEYESGTDFHPPGAPSASPTTSPTDSPTAAPHPGWAYSETGRWQCLNRTVGARGRGLGFGFLANGSALAIDGASEMRPWAAAPSFPYIPWDLYPEGPKTIEVWFSVEVPAGSLPVGRYSIFSSPRVNITYVKHLYDLPGLGPRAARYFRVDVVEHGDGQRKSFFLTAEHLAALLQPDAPADLFERPGVYAYYVRAGTEEGADLCVGSFAGTDGAVRARPKCTRMAAVAYIPEPVPSQQSGQLPDGELVTVIYQANVYDGLLEERDMRLLMRMAPFATLAKDTPRIHLARRAHSTAEFVRVGA